VTPFQALLQRPPVLNNDRNIGRPKPASKVFSRPHPAHPFLFFDPCPSPHSRGTYPSHGPQRVHGGPRLGGGGRLERVVILGEAGMGTERTFRQRPACPQRPSTTGFHRACPTLHPKPLLAPQLSNWAAGLKALLPPPPCHTRNHHPARRTAWPRLQPSQ